MATLLAAVALIAVAFADTQHCYYPDGTNADSGTSPCNTTAAVSACCDPRDSCTTSGLCLGASGWVYRSACTDQTWRSNSCPSQCQINPNRDAAYSSFAPIYACTPGHNPTKFCCGSDANPDCCASNFTLGNTGLAFKPGTDAVVAQLSSLSAALASATASANQTSAAAAAAATTSIAPSSLASSSSSSNHPNLGVAIGAGVGIPLSILTLGILAFLVWRERRRRPLGMMPDAVSPGSTYSATSSSSRAQFVGQPPMYQVNTPQAGWKEANPQNGRRLPSVGGGGSAGGIAGGGRTVEGSHELQS